MTENPLSQLETNSKPDYYDKTSKKVIDFLIGFIGSILLFILLFNLSIIFIIEVLTFIFIGCLMCFFYKKERKIIIIGMISILLFILLFPYSLFPYYSFSFITGGLNLAFIVWLMYVFYKKERKFITIGMISIAIISLLIFGGCMILIIPNI